MSRSDRIRRELARRELARRHYADYLALAYGKAWIPTRFSAYLAGRVQEFVEADTGNAYDILVLATPPQHGKSWTLTEALPSWWMGRHPEGRVILASYNDESAVRFARRNRDKLRDWGATLWGVELGGMRRDKEYELAGHRGRLISRGMLAGITGHPADLMVIDDPIKNREEADSQTIRDKLWGEWVNSLKSRLQAGAKVILIMTPWHEDDIAARMIQTETHITRVRLPVEAEDDDPMGRQPGEPLCPELGKGTEWLRQYKQSYISDPLGGARAWAALYQCSPRVEGGNLVLREWWRYYDEPPELPVQYISVDATFKGGEDNDYVAVTVWGKREQDYYLLDCINRHLTFTQTLSVIRETRRKWPKARAVLIEDKANGPAVIDVLQREMMCIPVKPEGGKEARVQAVAPAIESGHVYLPRGAWWLEQYIDQWCAFPAGAHDDMVDSSSQALNYMYGVPVPVAPTAEDLRRAREEAEARAALTDGGVYDNIYEEG